MENFQIPLDEIESQFIKFMQQVDAIPRDVSWSVDAVPAIQGFQLVADGQIHRYSVNGDKRGQKTGAYCLYSDGWPAGWVQNWRNGEAIPWRFERGKIKDGNLKKSLTQANINMLIEQSKVHQTELKARQDELHAGASMRALEVFQTLNAVFGYNHPYLQRKQVKSYGLRVDKDNRLAVGLMDVDTKFMSIQWISPDGEKRFFANAPTSGAFYSFGLEKLEKEKNSVTLIGEGYSTMATVFALLDEKIPCVSAMTCGNLMAVAKALKDKYPECRIVILADNDHHNKDNPGITAAQKVVKSLNLPVCVSPEFQDNEDGTDWNDYFLLHGREKTREVLISRIKDTLMTPEEKAEHIRQEKLSGLLHNLDTTIQIEQQEFIGGMFPRKFVSALVAPSGTGKTLFLQKFCSDLSIGGSIFDGFADNEPARKCLIFAGEAGFELMIRRGAAMKWAIYPPNVKVVDQYTFESSDNSVMLDDSEGWLNTLSIVRLCKPDIIFWDSFMSFHERDENKATEMKPIIKKLNDLARNFNCAVVLVHHSRKRTAKERSLSLNQDDVIGSSVFNRIVGLIIGIEPMKEDEKTLLVRPLKTWFSAFMPFTYRITEDLDGNTIMQMDLAPATVNNSKIAVWNYLISTFEIGEWFSLSDIIISEITPAVTLRQVKRILADFTKTGKLDKQGSTKGMEYSLTNTRNPE